MTHFDEVARLMTTELHKAFPDLMVADIAAVGGNGQRASWLVTARLHDAFRVSPGDLYRMTQG